MSEAARAFAAVSVLLSAAYSLVCGTKYESLVRFTMFLALVLTLSITLQDISFVMPEYGTYETFDAEGAYEERLVIKAEKDLSEVLQNEFKDCGNAIVSIKPRVNIDEEDHIYLEQLEITVRQGFDRSAIWQKARELVGDAVEVEVKSEDR